MRYTTQLNRRLSVRRKELEAEVAERQKELTKVVAAQRCLGPRPGRKRKADAQ